MSKILHVCLVLVAACMPSCGGDDTSKPESAEQSKYDASGCILPGNGVKPGQVCVRTLSALVKDLNGSPIPNLTTTACGDGCSYGKTDATGLTRMDVRRYMSKAALMLHGRSRWATYYARFDVAGDVDKGQLFLPLMPFDQGVDLPAAGEAKVVTFGDVTFSFSAGTELDLDTIELETAEEQRFRSVAVPLEKAPPFVAEAGTGFAAVYALTPYHTRIKPGAAVTLVNSAKLPAGAAVEVFVQATELDDEFGAFGTFSKAADGHVSADGTSITTDEGQTVPLISWLGVRVKG